MKTNHHIPTSLHITFPNFILNKLNGIKLNISIDNSSPFLFCLFVNFSLSCIHLNKDDQLLIWLDKCPVGQMSGWTKIWLDKCPVGQMSGWTNVLVGQMSGLDNGLVGQMSGWTIVQLDKRRLDKCLVDKRRLDKRQTTNTKYEGQNLTARPTPSSHSPSGQ